MKSPYYHIWKNRNKIKLWRSEGGRQWEATGSFLIWLFCVWALRQRLWQIKGIPFCHLQAGPDMWELEMLKQWQGKWFPQGAGLFSIHTWLSTETERFHHHIGKHWSNPLTVIIHWKPIGWLVKRRDEIVQEKIGKGRRKILNSFMEKEA